MYFFDVDGDQVLLGIVTFLLGRSSLEKSDRGRNLVRLITGFLFLLASAGYFVAAFRFGREDKDGEDEYDEIYGEEDCEA